MLFTHTIGGIIVIAMREEYLWTAEDFKDNKLENAIREMVNQNAWTLVSQQTPERYFKDKRGVLFVIKVLS